MFLGEGVYSKVYEKEGKVIKKYKKKTRKRYLIEVKCLELFKESNFVPLIYNHGIDVVPYIIMERLYENNLNREEFLSMLEDLFSFIKIVHDKGFSHNDIKWKNIMFTENKNLKLIDWNSASIFEHADMDYEHIAYLIIFYIFGEKVCDSIYSEKNSLDKLTDFIYDDDNWEDSEEFQSFIVSNLNI